MASTMYCLAPIVDSSVQINLPTCMYRMNPVNQNIVQTTNCSASNHERGNTDAPAEVAQLESRQEALLARLAELRSQVEAARQQFGGDVAMVTTVATSASAQTAEDAALYHVGELVVTASTACPPLSVLALRPLLPTLSVTSHVHSSASEVPETLRRQFCWQASAQPSTHLRVIWKTASAVSEPALLVSPGGQACPLAGEEQLCRYLARALLPRHYEGAGLQQAAMVDELLEQASRLRHGAGKERQVALKSLQSVLSSAPFLLGQRQMLVDGAVWSALRTSGLQSPPAVTAWAARMDAAAQIGKDFGVADTSSSRAAAKPTAATPAAQGRKLTRAAHPAPPVAKTTKHITSAPPSAKTTKSETKSAPKHKPAPKSKSGSVPEQVAALPAGASNPQHRTELGLLHYLARRDVTTETIRHPAVMTVEAMMPHLQNLTGCVTKNLFLRDKKKALYMLTTPHDAEFRLSDAAAQVSGAKEFRFAEEALLGEVLGIRPGCVSPFSLINDRACRVRLLLDRRLVDGTYDRVWLHPLTNTATTGVSAADLGRFLRAIGHEPTLLTLK